MSVRGHLRALPLPVAIQLGDAGIGPERARRSTREARSAPPTSARKRRPCRPSFETPRLAARELRIPIVVDDRAREFAAWGGLEPADTLWLLASLGWERWRVGWGAAEGPAP